ncbi:unnamed protein product [Rhizopus stolonifer]
MTSVQYLGLSTVINKEQFQETVVIKECPSVGRSLVAKKALIPGDIVLVEEPLIDYRLNPACRSSNSPYFTKKLWNNLINMVQYEEGIEPEDLERDDQSDYSDSSSGEEEEETAQQSDFCPGVPAAILAYLSICPPHTISVRNQRTFNKDDFDFFYYPNEHTDHLTVQLIRTVTYKVVETEPLFQHVDPADLCSFVLKIYSNAHTVSLPHSRTQPTHAKKKARRAFYKPKFDNLTTYWGEDEEGKESESTKPTITLLRWGSKFAHSCSPNMFLRYEPSRNVMVFTIIRPVKEGEVLSFTYLPEDSSTVGGLFCGSTRNRQEKLEKFKFFTCACERCLDWDWSRGVSCSACGGDEVYRGVDKWTCFGCGLNYKDQEIDFSGECEQKVVDTVMGFVSRVYGGRSLTQNTVGMLEPYLMDMLDAKVPVPKHHWTFGTIHSLLAAYHLQLFPQSYGKGLASQLGLTLKGLEETVVYLEFLNRNIFHHAHPKSASHGNPMTAFFASWQVWTIVINTVMENTEDKYAGVVYEKDSDGEDVVVKTEEPKETVLIPMPKEWVEPLCKLCDIIKEWVPFVEKVFQKQESPVVEDMIQQMNAFCIRVEKTQ